jgi:hypothetical protein
MKGKIFCFFLPLLMVLFSSTGFAQSDGSPEMADLLRSNGKIYVVLLTVLMVFAGMIAFLFSLEKRISKLEKNLEKK